MARILVIDDETIIAMTVIDWLGDLGHEALGPAGDLDAALALCEQPLDAAILDVSLQRRPADLVARRLHALGKPFAVASGHDPENMAPDFVRGLMLPKPFGFETFRRTVERLVGPGAI